VLINGYHNPSLSTGLKNATTCMKSALGSGLLAANSCVRGPCCSMQISSTKTSCLALRSN